MTKAQGKGPIGEGAARLRSVGWFAVVSAALGILGAAAALVLTKAIPPGPGVPSQDVRLTVLVLSGLVLLVSGIGVLNRREWARRTAIAVFGLMIAWSVWDIARLLVLSLLGRDLMAVREHGELLSVPRPLGIGHVISIGWNVVWIGVSSWALREFLMAVVVAEFSPRTRRSPVEELPGMSPSPEGAAVESTVPVGRTSSSW
jgi:hypothetical protein